MLFDARRGDRGKVYDIHGVLIPYAVSGDTITGRVICLVRDATGAVSDSAIREERIYDAPLRIEALK